MVTTSTDARVTAQLLVDVFCRCRTAVQSDVGNMAGELFHRVDIEGESLEIAAADLGLAPSEAKAFLSVTRCRIAVALVDHISVRSAPRSRGNQRSDQSARNS